MKLHNVSVNNIEKYNINGDTMSTPMKDISTEKALEMYLDFMDLVKDLPYAKYKEHDENVVCDSLDPDMTLVDGLIPLYKYIRPQLKKLSNLDTEINKDKLAEIVKDIIEINYNNKLSERNSIADTLHDWLKREHGYIGDLYQIGSIALDKDKYEELILKLDELTNDAIVDKLKQAEISLGTHIQTIDTKQKYKYSKQEILKSLENDINTLIDDKYTDAFNSVYNSDIPNTLCNLIKSNCIDNITDDMLLRTHMLLLSLSSYVKYTMNNSELNKTKILYENKGLHMNEVNLLAANKFSDKRMLGLQRDLNTIDLDPIQVSLELIDIYNDESKAKSSFKNGGGIFELAIVDPKFQAHRRYLVDDILRKEGTDKPFATISQYERMLLDDELPLHEQAVFNGIVALAILIYRINPGATREYIKEFTNKLSKYLIVYDFRYIEDTNAYICINELMAILDMNRLIDIIAERNKIGQDETYTSFYNKIWAKDIENDAPTMKINTPFTVIENSYMHRNSELANIINSEKAVYEVIIKSCLKGEHNTLEGTLSKFNIANNVYSRMFGKNANGFYINEIIRIFNDILPNGLDKVWFKTNASYGVLDASNNLKRHLGTLYPIFIDNLRDNIISFLELLHKENKTEALIKAIGTKINPLIFNSHKIEDGSKVMYNNTQFLFDYTVDIELLNDLYDIKFEDSFSDNIQFVKAEFISGIINEISSNRCKGGIVENFDEYKYKLFKCIARKINLIRTFVTVDQILTALSRLNKRGEAIELAELLKLCLPGGLMLSGYIETDKQDEQMIDLYTSLCKKGISVPQITVDTCSKLRQYRDSEKWQSAYKNSELYKKFGDYKNLEDEFIKRVDCLFIADITKIEWADKIGKVYIRDILSGAEDFEEDLPRYKILGIEVFEIVDINNNKLYVIMHERNTKERTAEITLILDESRVNSEDEIRLKI